MFTATNTFTAQISVTETTESTSADTGCVTLDGGIGVAGNVHCSGVYSHSDARLKDEITRIPNALDVIDNLGGYTFKWKKTGADAVGVVAQDVREHAPLCVIHDNTPEEYLSVNYAKLVPYLIESIRILKRQIQDHHDTRGTKRRRQGTTPKPSE